MVYLYIFEWQDTETLGKDKHEIGRLITVEIIEFLNDDAYLYSAYKKNDPDILYGIISKVN